MSPRVKYPRLAKCLRCAIWFLALHRFDKLCVNCARSNERTVEVHRVRPMI